MILLSWKFLYALYLCAASDICVRKIVKCMQQDDIIAYISSMYIMEQIYLIMLPPVIVYSALSILQDAKYPIERFKAFVQILIEEWKRSK